MLPKGPRGKEFVREHESKGGGEAVGNYETGFNNNNIRIFCLKRGIHKLE